jgi:hypothetical protein
MQEMKPIVLKLDGLSQVTASSVSEDDYEILSPGLKARIKEKIFHTYRAGTSKNKVENLGKSTELPEKPLILNTRGTYHHLTYGFLKSTTSEDEDIGYVHIDNHSDTYTTTSSDREIESGSFVIDILKLPQVTDTLFVGCEFEPSSSISSNALTSESWRKRFREEVQKLPDKVYISVDLDVFPPMYINCPFGQGIMTYRQFHFLIDEIKNQKDVAGADICGIDRPHTSQDRKLYESVVGALQSDEDEKRMEEMESEARKNIESFDSNTLAARNKYLLNQSSGD